jgi:DNA-binding CsgD family transcriptional regulator
MSGVQADALPKVIDQVYEAALRPELWRSLLSKVTDALGSDNAGIFTFPDPMARCSVWSEGNDEVVDWFVRDGWYLHNPRPARALRVLGPLRAGTESDLFTPWELEHLPFNAEIQHRMGYRWDAGAILGEINGNAVLFTTQRRSTRERFERPETNAIEAIAPHLARAVQMTERLGLAKGEGMLDALERMACAAVLIDYLGRPRRLNARAERLLGHGINVVNGRLGATNKSADAMLQQLIGDTLCHRMGGLKPRAAAVALPRRLPRGPLVAYALPILGSAQDVLQQAAAILIIVDPHEHREPADVALQQVFGLTKAEIRIARGLARGEDLKDIADKLGISIATARVQLKSVMAKSDTHRQSELVAVLARLALPSEAADGVSSRRRS